MQQRHAMVGVVLGLALCAAPSAQAQDAAQESEAPSTETTVQHWGGTIELPIMKLGVAIVFTTDAEGNTTGTIDIPMQNAKGLRLTDPKCTDTEISFSIPQVGASCMLERSGDTAKGTLSQMGQNFPTTLTRYESAEEALASIQPKRPQEPKPPFPYELRQVTIENEAGGVTLAGELTVPTARVMHPAVILITGSGPQDRDETIADHKPFLVIADHLTRNGIAVLRYDDRGMGGSTGDTMASTVLDYQSDVEAWLAWLGEQPGIDGARIGLLGHSEGASVAPLVASGALGEKVTFIVSLAGMMLPGDEVVIGQTREILGRSGYPQEKLDEVTAKQRELLEALTSDDATDETLRTLVGELIDTQNLGMPLVGAQREMAINGQMALVDSAWYRHLMGFDPRPALRQVQCPILAINGSLDVQVLPEENLGAFEEAAAAAGNTELEIMKIDGLNHMLQRATTGLQGEYGEITQTIDPQVLDLVTAWIQKQTGLGE